MISAMLVFLLPFSLVGHVSPLPTNAEALPVAPDFTVLNTRTEGTPLINCFHPYLGIIYGGTAGKAIYRANPDVGSKPPNWPDSQPFISIAVQAWS
jgi:hypothetical protein